jgi:hypothetical protein
MKITEAAKKLSDSIEAPKGAVSILPWTLGNERYLRVFLEPSYFYLSKSIPDSFLGFKVSLEKRPQTHTA